MKSMEENDWLTR